MFLTFVKQDKCHVAVNLYSMYKFMYVSQVSRLILSVSHYFIPTDLLMTN